MPAILLHAERLTRRHGDRTILDRVDLRISAHERIAIVGPNGSGKSTLLRILAGVEPVDGGEVHRAGSLAYLPQPGRRPTSTMPLRDAVAERLGIRSATLRLAGAERQLEAACDPRTTERAIAEHAKALGGWIEAGGPTFAVELERAADAVGIAGHLLDRPVRELSSGQASRAALVALAMAGHATVLVDEPSNHLDADGRAMLDELLGGHGGAIVLASHDRGLLERHAHRIVEIDPHAATLSSHAGGWAAHERERDRERRRAAEAYEAAIRKRDELRAAEREIRRRAAATRRRVAHAPRDPDKHHKEWFSARADGVAARGRVVGARAARVDVPERPWQDRPLALALTPAERQGWLVELSGAVARRGPWTSPAWSLAIRAGDRILLRGPNGAGKSTLLALIAGSLEPISGTRTTGAGAVIAELGTAQESVDRAVPLVDAVRALTGLSPEEVRGRLAQVGLSQGAVERPATTLSQGERTRAELAIIGARRTSCLLLDEPTDHLDLASVEAVESALAGWPGAVVLATHDERFAQQLGATTVIDV